MEVSLRFYRRFSECFDIQRVNNWHSTRKKSRWTLKQLIFGSNLIVAKIRAVFEEGKIRERLTKRQGEKIKQEVHNQLVRIPKEGKRSQNVAADTFIQIADKERRKAIRNVDYLKVFVADMAQYYMTRQRKVTNSRGKNKVVMVASKEYTSIITFWNPLSLW